MRNEIDIKEKSRGAIRNISGLNEEFQGMKLQFHRDGTPVSSHETPAHTSKNHPAFRNLSLLTLLLLFFSAGWNENGVWGQDGATITKASNNTSNDAETGVHIKKEIIYVDGSRELYVPEMRISMGDAFDWYIHWYVEGDGELAKPESIYINGQEAKDRGGDFPNEYASGYTSTSCLYTDNNKGFWWSDACNDSRHAVDASAIIYKLPENFTSGRVICDVSNNKDWDWISTNPYNFQEPTLLKRYVYEIRPASECVTKLNTEGPEEFVIDFPKGSSTVNFTMPSLPSNYFWGTSSPYSQGNKFAFSTKENGTYTDFYLIEKPSGTQKSLSLQQVQQINLSGVNSSVTYYVKVKDSNGNMFSNVVAKFTFNPIEDSGFVLEKDINSNRKPWENKELYEEIGSVDFDLDATETSLTPENNVSEKPMPRDETVYGFLQKKIVSLQNNTSTQNQYGLFRSANLTLNGTEISKNLQNIGGGAQGKFYLWIPTHMDANVDRKHLYDNRYLYDRTHLTDNTKYGYFYYIDASDDPGTIVDVSIDGTLCGYTELVVTAWVADMTRPRFVSGGSKYPLPANINLILKGTNLETQEEVVLHRFTSGDVVTDYSSSGYEGFNIHLMEWQQLCYRITLTDAVQNYTDFHLEVQNNEPHTDGADYAIDDVRVYKSKPNIKVQRYDACDAATLTVSLDYTTMLRNMGWTANEPIVDESTQLYSNDPENGFDLVKYRFGLNGKDATNPTKVSAESHVGNTYFSFVEGFDENTTENVIDVTDRELSNDEDPNPIVLEKGHQYRWVRVNKSLRVPVPQSMYSFRVINSTVYEDKNYPGSKDEALRREKILNLRAVKDYNTAVKLYNDNQSDYKPDSDSDGNITKIDLQGLTEENVTNEGYEDTYLKVIEELYSRLQIPRIRCSWIEADDPGRVYLYALDVNNTDLKYVGEQVGLDSEGNPIVASGEYHVVLQGAQAVENWEVPEGDADHSTSFNLKDPCVLISPFKVEPAVRITVETVNSTNALACLGTLRHIEADLIGTDGSELSDVAYSFDWFLGSKADYDKLTKNELFGDYDLKHAIEEFRKEEDIDKEFDIDDVRNSNVNQTIKEGLIRLFEQDLLQIATTEFTRPIQNDSIVAMPFIMGNNVVNDKIYCTDITAVRLGTYSEDVPILHPGYLLEPFKGEVSLRLGHPNMGESIALKVPLQKGFEESMADAAEHLKTADVLSGVAMYLNNPDEEYPVIGTAKLDISKTDNEEAIVTISLKEEAKGKLQEGKKYELLIPFAQYDNSGNRLSSECDGLITLPVKIVPQYLTWTGSTNDDWYNEDLWKQSTKGELYFDGYADSPNTDANGSDDIDDAYSPLYFTKITLSENKELGLIDASENKDTNDNRFLEGWSEQTSDGKDMADSIRYEMAVVNAEGKIEPYYINKVSEIYFKPNASMYRQDYLDYQKAWVEFESVPGTPYWMASPLKGIYAGDMYAPTNTGRQETPAFEDIHYNGIHEDGTDVNSRWNPAFYQKAWDKAITYANGDVNDDGIPDEDANETTTVSAVKSNWSIEYNDVTVPYSLGKGFYSRVEYEPTSGTANNSVMVRLPKADADYKYEPATRALTNTEKKDSDYGQLADGTEITIDLSKEDTGNTSEEVDGDGKHFLVGNPYMAYLNMSEFFKTNTNVVENKYWTINNGTVVVGTPDVDFEGEQKTGYIAPMTAFFIEVKDGVEDTKKKITFSTSMTAAKPGDTENVYTRSYEATNPQLTLTASSAKGKSRAAVVQSFDASNQYESDRDAVTLLDSELDAPTVYTVAGNYAAAVNAVHDCQNIPLGVYAKDNEEVELTVEGASQLTEPLYLYDAVTRSSTPIEGDSYTLNLTGSSHGRYFLTTDAGNIRVESDIRIYSPNGGQLIIAASPSDKLKQVQIYDLSGRMVESRKNIGASTYQLNVTQGIYIVRVISEQGSAEAKLRIR